MNKGRLLLQWHITEQCNHRCKHCYQTNYSTPELTIIQLEEIVGQYKKLLKLYNKTFNDQFYRGHINLTGGEPFIREDIYDLLNILKQNQKYFSFAILSNGSFINNETIKKIKQYNPQFIQLSIDGNQTTHDDIRGKGDFERTINVLKILHRNKIKAYISFTAHRNNYRQFKEISQIAYKYHVTKLWTDRLIPIGNGFDMQTLLLNPDECLEYFSLIKSSQRKKTLFNKTIVEMNRALMFQVSGLKPYHCSAGDTLITIMPEGTVYPCRRLPISAGSIINESLTGIYFESKIFKSLRNQTMPEGCKTCSYYIYCKGGAKCMTYAVKQTINATDPMCKIAEILNTKS